MAKYKFIKVKDENNRFDNSDIEFTVDTVSWTDLVEEFERFLKGCGFVFDGHLEVVEEDES